MHCRDKRDRVYGILGIAHSCDNFVVDYQDRKDSIADLFCRALELYTPRLGDDEGDFKAYVEDLWYVLDIPPRQLQSHVASLYQLFLDNGPVLAHYDELDRWSVNTDDILSMPMRYARGSVEDSDQELRDSLLSGETSSKRHRFVEKILSRQDFRSL